MARLRPRPLVRRAALLAVAPIPPLRPPHGAIPPSFWESHAVDLLLAVLALGLAATWVALIRRRRRSVRVGVYRFDALPLARRELTALVAEGGGDLPQRATEILHWCLPEYLQLPPREYTTGELADALAGAPGLSPGLREDLGRLLQDCDRARFAATNAVAPVELGTRALALLERLEETPSPLPSSPAPA